MKTFLLLTLYALSLPLQASSPVWLVESGSTKLFLAGTVHILRDSDYPLPRAFETAYARAQTLAFETDIAATQDTSFQQRLLKAIALPKGTSLKQLLKPQTLDRLQTYLQENQLGLNQFAGLKPSMIAMTMTMIELKKLGVGSQGVDNYFYQKARQDGKPTLALESVQKQIDFLAQMGQGQEDLMILQTLNEIETLETEFSHMLRSWRQGDTQKLEELFITPMKNDFGPIYQQLLVKRNRNWLPQLIEYMQTPEIEMVLVGSAHMPGQDGLLILLEKAGYQISQLD